MLTAQNDVTVLMKRVNSVIEAMIIAIMQNHMNFRNEKTGFT